MISSRRRSGMGRCWQWPRTPSIGRRWWSFGGVMMPSVHMTRCTASRWMAGPGLSSGLRRLTLRTLDGSGLKGHHRLPPATLGSAGHHHHRLVKSCGRGMWALHTIHPQHQADLQGHQLAGPDVVCGSTSASVPSAT